MTAKSCSIPLSLQFRELAKLADGWLNGEGLAYEPEFLRTAEAALSRVLATSGTGVPFVYPAIPSIDQTGSEVVVEWEGRDQVVMYIRSTGNRVSLELRNFDRDERSLGFGDHALSLQRLGEKLRNFEVP